MHDFCAILLRYNDQKGILRALFLCNVDFFWKIGRIYGKKNFGRVKSCEPLITTSRCSILEWIFYSLEEKVEGL